MPHIEIIGALPLEELIGQFEPLNARDGDVVVKATAIFFNTRDRRALIQALVAEPRVHRKFYLLLVEKKDSLMVRLDPLTDPEKTRGVKLLVALVAYWIRRVSPTSSYATTNLNEYLMTDPVDTLSDV